MRGSTVVYKDGINKYIIYKAGVEPGRGLRFHIDASCMCIVPYVT